MSSTIAPTDARAPALSVHGACKRFAANSAFTGVNLEVTEGSFVAIVGASGSGKTSLLRCIAGLDELTGGEIRCFGDPVSGPSPKRVYVFQDYGRSLFPWRSVLRNVMFPLEIGDLSKEETKAKALESLALVGLENRAGASTWQLSGGMQQRVAIARALAADPAILLMDEPFGAVDAQTRMNLQLALMEIWERLKKTILLVTHDIDEALLLADRVVVIDKQGEGLVFNADVQLPRPRTHTHTPVHARYRELRETLLRLLF